MSMPLPQALQSLQVIFNAQFQESYTQTPTVWNRIASRIEVNNAGQVVSGWLDRPPVFHEWKGTGQRIIDEIAAREWTTTIRDWQGTLKIDRNDILDDRIGVYTPTVRMQAEQAKKYPDVLLKTTIQGGSSSITWDGANFFAANHPINVDIPSQGTQSNLFTSTPLNWYNYSQVRANMQSLVGLDGQPLYVQPSILLVPPQLEVVAKNIIHADMVAVTAPSFSASSAVGPTTNTLKNTAEVVVMPELANDPTSWYLLDATKPMLPFLFADRQAPQFQLLISPTDPNVFFQKNFLFGWDSRGTTDYGVWFLAAKATA